MTDEDLKRFWSKVEKTEGCWFWRGTVDKGRPIFKPSGTHNTLAARIMYVLHYGQECKDNIKRSCNSDLCVNPTHLLDREAYFWYQVDKRGPDECWLWTGTLHSTGYGLFSIKKEHIKAHRAAWEYTKGPIPEGDGYHGMCICHKCDNRACCNPNHLFLGTHSDNMRDMTEKARYKPSMVRGEEQGNSKITKADVLEIRKLYQSGVTPTEIARSGRFPLERKTISDIAQYKRWKHIK